KYDALHQRLFEKRKVILNGEYEPNEEECDFPSDDDEEEEDKELCKDLEEKAKVEEEDENTKGIPDFWLTIFKNVDLLAEMVMEYDEPIISHLMDIKLKFHDEPMGFTLEFHFSENEYFTNKVLTKYYEMKCEPDKDDQFSFEGPEIIKCKGCTIDWKKGKNVTVKTIKKKQKHKSRGSVRTITKTVQNDSFFNFFSPSPVPDDPEEDMDEDTQALLTADFEIGHYIRERIVPRAVLFFTGEALDDEDYDEEGEEEGGCCAREGFIGGVFVPVRRVLSGDVFVPVRRVLLVGVVPVRRVLLVGFVPVRRVLLVGVVPVRRVYWWGCCAREEAFIAGGISAREELQGGDDRLLF
ncbi:UNVERIFIED_CONTAM: hypothetical protein GTU68_042690, partial [Idotea baltica]|nr:hypothetical protein [Idotea baltica]